MNSPSDDEPRTEQAQSVVYLTVNDLYNINEQVVRGIPFVRDYNLLASEAKRPRISLFGQPQFPTLLDKAAALMHSLAYRHLFADGNKRTAARATRLFLEHNGIQPTWSETELADYLLQVAQGQFDTDAIAEWLANHTTEANL